MSAPIVFVDTETTGLDERHHDAWDVALVSETGDDHYQAMIPVDLGHADPAALRIGGYYERTRYRDGTAAYVTGDMGTATWERYVGGVTKSPATVALDLARVTNGAILVGVNPQFDARFITKILRAHGCEPTWNHRLIDLNAMTRGYLLGKIRGEDTWPAGIESILDPKIGSHTLSGWVGVDRPADHTALGDARWARDWHHALTSQES